MTETQAETKKFPATVAKLLNEYEVVINMGIEDGVKMNQQFLIYRVDLKESIIDPETKKDLGFLEIVKGTGKVIHVQEHMATIRSNRNALDGKRIIRRQSIFGDQIEEVSPSTSTLLPFENAMVGDKAKPI